MKVAATTANKQNQSIAVANNVSQQKNNSRDDSVFVDNRPETKALKSLQMMINDSPRMAAQRQRTSNITRGTAQGVKGPETSVPNGPAESSKFIRLYAPSQVFPVSKSRFNPQLILRKENKNCEATCSVAQSESGEPPLSLAGGISSPIQRKVILHPSFLSSLTQGQEQKDVEEEPQESFVEVYKDDTANVKLKDLWEQFTGSPQYQKVDKAPINVYVTNNPGKSTAAYIRNVYDTDNFKEHVGELAEDTSRDRMVHAVVNFNLEEIRGGLDLSKSNPIYAAEEVGEAEPPSKLPVYYVLTHEFGHVMQYLSSVSTDYDLLFQVDTSEKEYKDLPKEILSEWLTKIEGIYEIARSEDANTLMRHEEKFKLMLLSDVIDGYLMARRLDDLRQDTIRIKWFLTTAVEYDNMIMNEIIPSVQTETLDYKEFPVRTEHGIERQLEQNLPKEEAAEPPEKQKIVAEEPVKDAVEIMQKRLQNLCKKMVPVFEKYLGEFREKAGTVRINE